MKHLLSSLLLASLFTAACVDPPASDPDVASDGEAIVNGTPQNAQSFGVGVVAGGAAPCSATMISPEVALTTPDCARTATSITVAGSTQKVRELRVMRFANETEEHDIAVIQLWKPLALAGGGNFSRGVSATPLQVGDRVDCFGITGGVLASGAFDVVDGSDAFGRVFLRGRADFSGNVYAVSPTDLGGFCQRDGGGIVAILFAPTSNNVAVAATVADLGPSIADMRYASSAADQGVAIRLRDAAAQRFLDAVPGTPEVHARAAAADVREQAFYLDDVTNPPAGGTEWYRFVDARSGRCLTASGAKVVQLSCDRLDKRQMWYLDYVQFGGAGRYVPRGMGGVLDANPHANGGDLVSIAPDVGAGSQRWEMWLTQL